MIKSELRLNQVHIHADYSQNEVDVKPSSIPNSGVIHIRSVNWSSRESFETVIFGKDEFLQDLEHALNVYNQERHREKNGLEVHSAAKNGVEIAS